MIKKIKLPFINLSFVFRHRWEKGGMENYEAFRMKKEFEFGLWFKWYDAVGRVRKGKDRDTTIRQTFSDSNLVRNYVLGVNLIVCKAWVTVWFKPTFREK
jgi:hypothetical protein